MASEKPVIDFGPTDPENAPAPATSGPAATSQSRQPDADKKRLTKTQKRMRRWARSGFAIFVAVMPILSFGLTMSSLVSASWAHKFIKADETQWYDVSPVNGNCTCDSTHVNYCAETSDAFEGTAYLSVTVILSQLLLAFVYSCELGMYGLFGGSHNFTRITLIIALLALSTQILSVISWFATFDNNHCGDPSFESKGASLGWPFFVRCIECAGMLGFVLYITSLFPKTNRGPPSMPLLVVVFAMMITCVTTFLRGWMTLDNLSYSPWAACDCTDTCSGVSGMLSLALATGALAVVTGFVTIFFMSLRAVDNEGLTLKVASVTSAITVLFQMLVVLGYYLAFGASCEGGSLSDQGFKAFWPSSFAVAALVTQIVFFTTNTVYMMRGCCDVDDESAIQHDYERTIFYRFWWDHLKDPRTLAHEAREEEEDDGAGTDSDDDQDEEEDEMAANKAAAAEADGGDEAAKAAEEEESKEAA